MQKNNTIVIGDKKQEKIVKFAECEKCYGVFVDGVNMYYIEAKGICIDCVEKEMSGGYANVDINNFSLHGVKVA